MARKTKPSHCSTDCSTIATEEGMFPVFRKLPPEMRNKIWGFAANNEPRTLDIWSDFLRCEIANCVFFTQKYTTELAKPKVPALLHTSRESRAEALKHYKLEFRTHTDVPSTGVKLTLEARIFINYASDILVPRGFWNIVSFEDFAFRVRRRGLKHLAIDTEGSFWTTNLRDYCTYGNWSLNGVQELILYDSRREKFWKGMDYLDKFKKRYKGGPRSLVLEELDGDKSDSVRDVEMYLRKTFDRIEGKEENVEEESKSNEDVAQPQIRKPTYLNKLPITKADDFKRPNITYRKLVAKEIIAKKINT